MPFYGSDTQIANQVFDPVHSAYNVTIVGGSASGGDPTHAEDSVANSGDIGSFALSVRRDGVISSSPVNAAGDYQEFATDQWGQFRQAIQARLSNPTAAADGNGVVQFADKLGRIVAQLGQARDLRGKQNTTITASTSEATIVTAAASTFNDLVALVISNTSATPVRLDVRDTTGGTVLFSLEVPASDTRGFVLTGSSIPQATVNTNWTIQSSASVTDLRILSIFEKNI